MKSTFFQSLGIAFGFLTVGVVFCYGVMQMMYLLEGFTSEIVRCETWLASGMGR